MIGKILANKYYIDSVVGSAVWQLFIRRIFYPTIRL